MTSPYPLDITGEMYYDGAWHDISDDVRQTSDITMRWGRADEASVAAPNELGLLLNNGGSNVNPAVSGRYSPRNPHSDLFGKIGRNTPVRVRLGDSDVCLVLGGFDGSYVSTPDASTLDITGDLDVRVEVAPTTWRPHEYSILAAKYQGDGAWSWVFYRNPDGKLSLAWTTGGSLATRVLVASTAAVSDAAGRLAVRVTLDVNNGSAGKTVIFYTASAIDGTWTQLGTSVVTAGTTSVFSGGAPLTIGAGGSGDGVFADTDPFAGRVYAAEVYSGIGGTLVAAPTFTAQEVGAGGTFTDGTGLVWTVSPMAYIDDPASIRMVGEIAKMPTEWDVSGSDVWVPVTAKSINRRLAQGAAPLRSSLFRDLSNAPNVVAYWPMEDGKNATTVAAAIGRPLTVTGGVTMAAYSDFTGSEPVPTFGTGGHITGLVPAYTPHVRQRFACMLHQDAAQAGDRNLIATRCIGGTVSQVILVLKADGSLRLVLRNLSGGNLLDDAGAVGDLRDEKAMVWVLLEQDGNDIDFQYGKIAEGESFGTIQDGTLSNARYGRYTQFNIGSDGDLSGSAVGHLHLVNGDDGDGGFWNTALNSLQAWDGETAGDRIIRLSGEERVPLTFVGDPADTAQMGPQGRKKFLDLLRECAEADLGILDDHTRLLAKRYRTRTDLYNQDVTLTLDYSQGEAAPPLRPVSDDQAIRNDVTVSRGDGSSARSVQETGPLNVQDPTEDPQGVGRYDESKPLVLHSDLQLGDQAGWRRHLGTVDEDRYPSIMTNLGRNPHLTDDVKALDPGDRVQITNPPDWMPAETIDQLAQGGRETLNTYRHEIDLVCTPASPWSVAVVSAGGDGFKAHSDGSTVAADFVAGTDTSMTVAIGHFEDFEDTAYVTPITGTWSRTNTTSHAGTWSLGSPDIDDGEQADAVMRIPAGTTQVGFWYRVSSEAGFDFLEVYVDDVLVLSDDGDTGWVEVPLFDVDGASTLTFRYVKDSSDSSLLDAAFVDAVHFSAESIHHPRWITDAEDEDQFPIVIMAGGVELEVTAINGTASPQTFTVTQEPLNGIEKTIPAGTAVQVKQPMTIAL